VIVWKGDGAPPKPRSGSIVDLDHAVAEFEARWIITALETAKGDKAKAARLLGLGRTTLLYRINKLGIVPKFEVKECA
jgi:DNA-binding NtrC family response regulator